MKYIDWNIKCYCNIEKITAYLLSEATESQCIIALQEVLPDRKEYIVNKLGDEYNYSYSLDYRKPDDEFDTDNRRLGLMILVSKDIAIKDTGVFTRCLFPERTLFATLDVDGKEIKVVNFHSITGVSFKMGKAVQFRSLAESIRDYKPDLVSFDANEPKKDSCLVENMEFFNQGDSGKGARLFFNELVNQGLKDAYINGYDDLKENGDMPLAVSHILSNGVKRRYDFVFANDCFTVNSVMYEYNKAVEASSDHAMIIVELE